MCGTCDDIQSVSARVKGSKSATRPRGSIGTPVWRPIVNRLRHTRAPAKARGTSPPATRVWKITLSPSSGWISGAPAARAASGDSTAGSGSYATPTSAAASSAAARSSAAIATTGSPTQRTRSSASGTIAPVFMPL